MCSNNSYSQTKFSLEARDTHKHKGKSCGYYMRIIFFFSSLIQSLIIMSLVLFLVYGQPEKSAEEKRLKELEQSFNRISENNIKLRKDYTDLAATQRNRTTEKTALELEVASLKRTNTGQTQKLILCESEKKMQMSRSSPVKCVTPAVQFPVINPTTELKTLQSRIKLIETNFTQTTKYISIERDNAIKERDAQRLESTNLRGENTNLKEQLTLYIKKCKEDFSKSLEGIQAVTSNFLMRIEKLFPHSMTFQLTCEKQSEQMNTIKSSCSSLSKEVEEKFQRYLDNVGMKVADIQALSSRLEVQNNHLTIEIQQCQRNHSMAITEADRLLMETSQKHDQNMESRVKEQNQLREEMSQKVAEISKLKENLSAANCNTKGTSTKASG